MDSYNLAFPAIRGRQAKKEYWVAMCPLKLVPRILVFDSAEIAPEFRSQRVLNKSRLPQLIKYLVDNPEDYVFSALTVSVDREVEFTPAENSPNSSIGHLVIPMDANILINDGQHRRAAIERALEDRPELGNETIPIVFFLDTGLKRSQQMFADLNRYAIRPTRSLSILYDHRDEFSSIVHEVIKQTSVFNGMIELEKTSISNRSQKLFTLSSLYQANKALLAGKDIAKDQTLQFALDFWPEVAKAIPIWQLAKDKQVSCAEMRKDFIHAHGVAIHAMGMMGASLIQQYPRGWKSKLKPLQKIDWRRTNKRKWEGRSIIGGRMSKTSQNVRLTANTLKKAIGVKLSKEDRAIEKQVAKG